MKRFKILIMLVAVAGISLIIHTALAATDTIPSFEIDSTSGPAMVGDLNVIPNVVDQNEEVSFSVKIEDVSGVDSAIMQIKDSSENLIDTIIMYDNGTTGGDTVEADGIYSSLWNSGTTSDDIYSFDIIMKDRLGNSSTVTAGTSLQIGNGTPINLPTIQSSLTTTGVEGVDFTYSIVANNAPTNYDAIGLPAGLSINTTDGIISGIPDANTSVQSPYNVEISAINAVGTDTQTLVLTITALTDTTPPAVSILSPLDSDILDNDTVIVKALATDNDKIASVEYYIDDVYINNQLFEYDSVNNPGEYWQTMTISPGLHTIKVIAYDNSNNMTEYSVQVDYQQTNSAPVINQFMDVDIFGVQHVGDYDNADQIKFRVDSSDDSLITIVELYKNGGSGTLRVETPPTPLADYLTTFTLGASEITYLNQAIQKYADETDSFKLPFIPVAKAAIIGNQNCTTTTTPRDRQIYAIVYDDTDLSTTSGVINITINTTTTSCVPYTPPAS